MRVLLVVVGLVVSPTLVTLAEAQGQPAATSVAASGQCAMADEHRSPSSWENGVQAAEVGVRDWGGKRVGCSPVPPAPPAASCGVAPSASGTSSITGSVRHSDTGDPLVTWCLDLSGAAEGSAVSDANGEYGFSNVPSGSYLVCLVIPDGWEQTSPSNGSTLCPSGYPGRSFSLSDGQSAGHVSFKARPK